MTMQPRRSLLKVSSLLRSFCESIRGAQICRGMART
jgi:hypothetical protein